MRFGEKGLRGRQNQTTQAAGRTGGVSWKSRLTSPDAEGRSLPNETGLRRPLEQVNSPHAIALTSARRRGFLKTNCNPAAQIAALVAATNQASVCRLRYRNGTNSQRSRASKNPGAARGR